VENVLEAILNYYDDKEEGALTFQQIVPGKYYRYNRDYGICEILESASNKPKTLRYLNRDGGLMGSNGDLFEVDMTDRLLEALKKRREESEAFIDEMGTW
jgi:hypothetical protein